MTAFEYLSVLLSIILGLAITQVLGGYRGLLLARGTTRLHAPSLIWSGFVLLIATQAWWASFGLETRREWDFGTFVVILVQMGLIYMLAALVLPDVGDGAAIDLEVHHEAQRRPFFAFLLALIGVSLFKDFLLNGALPTGANLVFHALMAAVAVAGLLLRGRKAHLALAGTAAALLTAYVALLFARL